MTLVEFLEARLFEDERAANASYLADVEFWAGLPPYGPFDLMGSPQIDCTMGTVDHIRRNRPTKVMADCAAKRRLVTRAAATLAYAGPDDENEWVPQEWVAHEGRQDNATDILRTLAAVYAAHPDYQDEWAL